MGKWLQRIAILLGLTFLYAPLCVMVIYSFNGSNLLNIWGGWSLRWYHTLFQDTPLLSAAWLSLRIGLIAPSVGVIIGTLSAIVLQRFGSFKGRHLFYAMHITPIIMPDVVIGLALLLMFVSFHKLINIPGAYGFSTILIAHITFCSAYATIVINGRLANVDRSLEEAAMDLGARPLHTFFNITLAQISTTIAAAWLLCFILSLDDVVITTFVTGPGATTLPIYIFSTLKTGITPEINALATIMITLIVVSLGIGVWLHLRLSQRQRRKRADQAVIN